VHRYQGHHQQPVDRKRDTRCGHGRQPKCLIISPQLGDSSRTPAVMIWVNCKAWQKVEKQAIGCLCGIYRATRPMRTGKAPSMTAQECPMAFNNDHPHFYELLLNSPLLSTSRSFRPETIARLYPDVPRTRLEQSFQVRIAGANFESAHRCDILHRAATAPGPRGHGPSGKVTRIAPCRPSTCRSSRIAAWSRAVPSYLKLTLGCRPLPPATSMFRDFFKMQGSRPRKRLKQCNAARLRFLALALAGVAIAPSALPTGRPA